MFQVTRHLLKLFDNIADLRFKDSGGGGNEEANVEVVAVGMYSREGEYVQFSEPCVCEGQVAEKRGALTFNRHFSVKGQSLLSWFIAFIILFQAEGWLSALESTMRRTVRKDIQEAVAAYEDKPRDQWLFDYPAQVL